MGFLIRFVMEHHCVAHAYELLCQDCECDSTKVSEKTAGQGDSCIDKKILGNRHIQMKSGHVPRRWQPSFI